MTEFRIDSYARAAFPKIKRICNALYKKGMLAGADGNVSIRLPLGRGVLITASGVHKGFLRIDDLVATDWHGKVIYGNGRPSSEIKLHMALYEKEEAVGAIVHTHAPWATALNLSGLSFDTTRLVEAEAVLKEIVTVPYHPPGTEELAQEAASRLGGGPALILERHGAVTCGKDLEMAFFFMECLEHNAKILAIAHMLTSR